MTTGESLEYIRNLLKEKEITLDDIKDWLTDVQFHDLTLRLHGYDLKSIVDSRAINNFIPGRGKHSRYKTNTNASYANCREAALKVILKYKRMKKNVITN